MILMAFLQVNYLIGDGKSHWLEGVLLMMMYLIIALAAWYVLEEICLALDSESMANLGVSGSFNLALGVIRATNTSHHIVPFLALGIYPVL